jgi:hypothetical protein
MYDFRGAIADFRLVRRSLGEGGWNGKSQERRLEKLKIETERKQLLRRFNKFKS